MTLAMTLDALGRITGLMTMRQSVEGASAAILAGLGMGDFSVRIRDDVRRVDG